jgi:hypothetical protein
MSQFHVEWATLVALILPAEASIPGAREALLLFVFGY